MRYAFIRDHRETWPVEVQCRVLEVSRSGYYAWLRRPPSLAAQRRAQLTERIRQIHTRPHHGNYGAPRVHRELLSEGCPCNRKTVEKLMCQAGLRAKTCRRFRVGTTDSRHSLPVAANLLARKFQPTAKHQAWTMDITYIRLFGNIMSGTMIVGILLTITPLVFPIFMNLLGLLTGMVQAYIFSILATVYIAAGLSRAVPAVAAARPDAKLFPATVFTSLRHCWSVPRIVRRRSWAIGQRSRTDSRRVLPERRHSPANAVSPGLSDQPRGTTFDPPAAQPAAPWPL